jgi:hypothetical protein
VEVEGWLTNDLVNFERKEERKVYIRISKEESKKRQNIDANTLWEVFPMSPVWGGEKLNWDSQFRLQHVPTGLFMAVDTSAEGEKKPIKMVADHR